MSGNCSLASLVALALAALALPLAGCDRRPPAYPAGGRVIFEDGSPAHVGSVELKSRSHPVQARGEIGADGRFTLSTYEPGDGAVAGKHECVVVQFVMAEEITGHEPTTQGVIDPRFGSYATSGLECEISADEPNQITLRVQGVSPAEDKDHERHEHKPE